MTSEMTGTINRDQNNCRLHFVDHIINLWFQSNINQEGKSFSKRREEEKEEKLLIISFKHFYNFRGFFVRLKSTPQSLIYLLFIKNITCET